MLKEINLDAEMSSGQFDVEPDCEVVSLSDTINSIYLDTTVLTYLDYNIYAKKQKSQRNLAREKLKWDRKAPKGTSRLDRLDTLLTHV